MRLRVCVGDVVASDLDLVIPLIEAVTDRLKDIVGVGGGVIVEDVVGEPWDLDQLKVDEDVGKDRLLDAVVDGVPEPIDEEKVLVAVVAGVMVAD